MMHVFRIFDLLKFSIKIRFLKIRLNETFDNNYYLHRDNMNVPPDR